jgi:hypothetical protein
VPTNNALLTDAYSSPLRAQRGAARQMRTLERVPVRTLLTAVLMPSATLVGGCGPLGLFFPYEVQEYYPNARWGEFANAGGCPSHTPAVEVRAKNPDWVWVKVGIWDSEQTKLRKLTEPTLFIDIFYSWYISGDRAKTAGSNIAITSPNPYLDVTLADGTSKRIALNWLEREYTWRTRDRDIPLGVAPKDMTVIFPDLVINGEQLPLGAVQFTYRKNKRYPC